MAQRAGIFLRSLPDRALIDRLVRSQAWILVLGLMLAGIVAMQVEVLKLGASVGRSIERGSALQGRNQLLRASVASLSDDARIERLAADMGMIMPPPGAAGFVAAGAPNRTLQQALANIHAPDPATFLASTAANGAVTSSSIMSNTTGSVVANPPLQSSSSATSSTSSTAAAATPSTTAATPSTTAATPTTTAATPSTTAATPSTAAATPSSTSTATTASTAAQQQPATAGG